MASILGFFFIIILIILIFGLSIISSIFRVFFGLGKKGSKSSNRNYSNQQTSSRQETVYEQKKHKKIFDNDEGEYVDFEEIKDNK